MQEDTPLITSALFFCKLQHRWKIPKGIKNLSPIFLQAAALLNIPQKNNKKMKTTLTMTLYIHWMYHPKGLQQQNICQLYNAT
jgi:hypothetical protein